MTAVACTGRQRDCLPGGLIPEAVWGCTLHGAARAVHRLPADLAQPLQDSASLEPRGPSLIQV